MPHVHEKIDFTVEVMIVFNGKVLLQLHDKYNKWLGVGGHIELDEDPNQAAVREAMEEVGLSIELYRPTYWQPGTRKDYVELIPPLFLNRHAINETHEHVTMTYVARATTDTIVPEKPERKECYRWVTANELQALPDVDPLIKTYAQEALDRLS